MKPLTKKFLALLVCVQATVVFPAGAEESILHPDGVNADPGWALNRVGELFSPGVAYSYPDTTVPVRLYLIDTAVADPASFVAANPKLTFEGPIIVRGVNDPSVSTPRAHGTQLLSLIAGVDTGIAPGTPIHVVNYDIYPNATTTSSLLSSAIIKATAHHKNPETPKMRAAICIATSSADTALSPILESNINAALAAGIPVILSAGNLNQDASAYVPSSNGTKNGVICVGGSNTADLKLGISNHGAPVDILAPGESVRTRSENATSAFVPMTGTSAATALVAGSVLAELSINGSLTPVQVEDAIKAYAIVPASGSGPKLLRTTYACELTIINPDGPIIPASAPLPLAGGSAENGGEVAPLVDSDADGFPDMIEIFHSNSTYRIPAPSVITRTGDQMVQFKFPISFDNFRSSDPFTLENGYSWKIECMTEAKGWDVPVGSLSKTTDASGQAWLVATFPAGQIFCYARIGIFAP